MARTAGYYRGLVPHPESKLVHLKNGSAHESVLVVPDIGGSVLTFALLARTYPGPEHVVGLELASPAALPVAGLASSHLSAARSWATRSDLPWHLVGHGFGATVVMEMAHQLEQAGERPGALIFLQPLLRLGGADDPQVLGLDAGPLAFGGGFARNLLEHASFALAAYREHSPRPLASPVHLVVTAGGDDTARRLRDLTGGVTRHELPCPPGSLLRQPMARTVASTIASLVAESRSEG